MSSFLKNKSVLLGVSGGIAAYKSIELLRLLKKQGANVRVILTKNAARFAGPLTFQTLSENPVCLDLFNEMDEAGIRHIEWAKDADFMVIAPATANCLAKLANGIADDALTTMVLAVTAPLVVCPSMNTNMYLHPATRRNLEKLATDGAVILTPDSGDLACGVIGPGRLPEPEFILDRLEALAAPRDLAGKSVLVTAGPTWEHMDPVRFVANPSSGKMGFALAKAAEHRGAAVALVTGPVGLPDLFGVDMVRVRSAQEMAEAVLGRADGMDVIIKAAAVSDFAPAHPFGYKLKKGEDTLTVDFIRTPDILKELGKNKKNQVLVGFAAETDDLEAYAREKLARKNLDMIAANWVKGEKSAFGSDVNQITLFFQDGGSEVLPEGPKTDLAHLILDRIITHCLAG